MFSPSQPALSLRVECQKEEEQEQDQGKEQEQERGGGTLASGAEGLLAAALARAMAA